MEITKEIETPLHYQPSKYERVCYHSLEYLVLWQQLSICNTCLMDAQV